jgi:hypothetical protein
MGEEIPPLTMIKRLTIFPVLFKNNWIFRISVSDQANVLIYAMHAEEPIFMMRFFDDEELAVAWIDECIAGKHVE